MWRIKLDSEAMSDVKLIHKKIEKIQKRKVSKIIKIHSTNETQINIR